MPLHPPHAGCACKSVAMARRQCHDKEREDEGEDEDGDEGEIEGEDEGEGEDLS